MAAKTYARIDAGTVMELFRTDGNINVLFHPSLHWFDVTGQKLAVGWTRTATGFGPPALAKPSTAPLLAMAEIEAQVKAIEATVKRLTAAPR